MDKDSTSPPNLRELRTAAAISTARPEYAKIIQPQAAGRFTRTNMAAIEPPKLVSIMRTAQTGDLEDVPDDAPVDEPAHPRVGENHQRRPQGDRHETGGQPPHHGTSPRTGMESSNPNRICE